MDALCQYGYEATALAVIMNKEYPGWFDMVKNNSTLTERWDGKTDSLDHCMFGSVDAQLYKLLGGIRLTRRETASLIIKPYFSDICSYVQCSTDFNEGKAAVSWTKNKNIISVHVVIPENCNAQFILHDDFDTVQILCGTEEKGRCFSLPSGEIDILIRQ